MTALRELLSSFLPSSAPDGTSTARRAGSCPPLALPRRLRWARRPWLACSRADALAEARIDFAETLHDIRNPASLDVRSRIAATRSLHELWHFREEVFSLVARRHDQAEATRRLAGLNRHFNRQPARLR
jgi:hypothetical protein